MMNARKEMSSAEQLVELRKARDRYKALADRFREEGDAAANQFESESDPLIVMQEKLKHERDARRIANAYEKSIANIVARSEAMQQAQTSGPSAQEPCGPVDRAGGVSDCRRRDNFGRRISRNLPAGVGLFSSQLEFCKSSLFLHGRPSSTTRPSLLRQRRWRHPPVVEKEQPKPLPPKRALVTTPVPPKKPAIARRRETGKDTRYREIQDEGGFTAKVLLPDGTFKEQRFFRQAASLKFKPRCRKFSGRECGLRRSRRKAGHS